MTNLSSSKPYSPLRYPGGKGKLAGFVKSLLRTNRLLGGSYAEPYAGGAAVGINLLLTEHVTKLYLNDISHSLYCFWNAILSTPDALARLIHDTPVTATVWDQQKAVLQNSEDHAPLSIGFAYFFLNRTNRSGVMNAGMIGGRSQTGRWGIDARYNKAELIDRILAIADYSSRIEVHNLDAAEFLSLLASKLRPRSLIYLDPPYYHKGQHLYANFYHPGDHASVAKQVQESLTTPWIVSYDDCPEVRELYADRRYDTYSLDYTARERRTGSEIVFYADCLTTEET